MSTAELQRSGWGVTILAASGALEPTYPTHIHLTIGGTKGDTRMALTTTMYESGLPSSQECHIGGDCCGHFQWHAAIAGHGGPTRGLVDNLVYDQCGIFDIVCRGESQ